MRINKFVALASGLSRRKADSAIIAGRVTVNGRLAEQGIMITQSDIVKLDNKVLVPAAKTTIMFNKPAGYVVSRDGQGSPTIYDLLPPEYRLLNPVGRLDKDSSGLLLLTNDGNLAHELTHPSKQKQKVYQITLYKPLQPLHRQMISNDGIQLDDGLSKLQLDRLKDGDDTTWTVTMHEGRNRQIRRTFAAINYEVKSLHRTQFGNYRLGVLITGKAVTVG